MDTLGQVVQTFSSKVVVDGGADPDAPLEEMGVDSLDLVELMLDLEEVFPTAHLEDYEPEMKTTLREIAAIIEGRLA